MSRLLVHVEGETEETFVNEVLCRHLLEHGYGAVSARIVGNARLRSRRGGIKGWPEVKRDIVNHLRQDPGCIATTMVDYYALPQAGEKAWPGRAQAAPLPYPGKASVMENALRNDIAASMGNGFDPRRFVPFVVIHEFEGLLFSDCDAFARGVGRQTLAPAFQQIRDQFGTPEEINDSPITAPSKRVEALIPSYQKPLYGNLAALEVGLTNIRAQCPVFRAWLDVLESRAALLS